MPTPGIHHTSPIVPQSSSSSLKTGDMIGIIVGGMVGACALCCVLFWIRKMMKVRVKIYGSALALEPVCREYRKLES